MSIAYFGITIRRSVQGSSIRLRELALYQTPLRRSNCTGPVLGTAEVMFASVTPGVPGAGAAGTKKADGKTKTGVVPMSGQDEVYWRGKAHELLDQITATEQQIAKLKDDIKKYGTGGFDVTTGMKSNVAYIEDRNGQVKDLEKRKADLEKKLDQLEEQGRKAGAEPAWFR
jgi:polyhydroxyalkanoate synthesis regulator phasin